MQMEQEIMCDLFADSEDEPVVTPEPAAKKKPSSGKKDVKAVENEFDEEEEKPKKKGPGKKDVKA
eukprot:2443324-Karenia_brevis.AAC.1